MTIAKFPKHWAGILTPLLLSLLMTCVVSAISVLRAHGFEGGFFLVWPSAWGMSWLVAFPVLLLVLPLVRRMVAAMVRG